MEEGGGGPAVDWANLDSDLLLLISGKLPGPGVGAQECVCKPWREAIASDPAVYLRLLRGVAPAEAEQLVSVRGPGGYGGVTSLEDTGGRCPLGVHIRDRASSKDA